MKFRTLFARTFYVAALGGVVFSAQAQEPSFDSTASGLADATPKVPNKADKKGPSIEVNPQSKETGLVTATPTPPTWKLLNESRLGIVVANGNSKTQTYSLTHESKFVWPDDLLKFNLAALKSVAGEVKTAENYALGLRYERSLAEKVSIFVGQNVQGDIFSGYRQQYNTDVGGKYFFVKDTAVLPANRDLNLFAEGGYRFTKTNWQIPSSTNKDKLNYLRLYVEGEKYLSPTFSTKLWVEYLPNLTVAKDWQINTELSVSAALNGIFAMQSAFLLKQDNVPSGRGIKTDTLFTTGLTAKF